MKPVKLNALLTKIRTEFRQCSSFDRLKNKLSEQAEILDNTGLSAIIKRKTVSCETKNGELYEAERDAAYAASTDWYFLYCPRIDN